MSDPHDENQVGAPLLRCFLLDVIMAALAFCILMGWDSQQREAGNVQDLAKQGGLKLDRKRRAREEAQAREALRLLEQSDRRKDE